MRRGRITLSASRLAQGGQRYVPEGGGEAFVLVTSTSSSQSELATTDRSASVHDSTSCILAGDLRVQLITLQKADSSTLIHGDTLQAWQHHFDGAGKLQKLAAEAEALGLLTHVGGVVMTISEATLTGPISVPVIPGGVVTGLNGMIGTNVDTDWKLRDWLLFVAHEMDYHRPHRDMRDSLVPFVWWPSLLRDARSWVERCDHCMEQKPTKRMKLVTAPRLPWGLIDLDARGKHIAIDHCYPNPTWISPANPSLKAFLVITDLSTGYTLLCGAEDVRGSTTAKLLYGSWVSIFGVPLSVTGDNFIDAPSLRTPLQSCGVRSNTVPAYSPFSNGSAEERLGRVKRVLPTTKLPWDQALPFVQLSINSQKRVSGHSAAELMFGTQIRTPSASVLSAITNNTPIVHIGDLETLATSAEVPDALREVLKSSVGAARISTLQAHVRDCLRASAARPGRPLKDGELVVWRRPESRPVEGTVRLVSGVHTEDGPFCYLRSLAGFVTKSHPLGSPPGHSVSVSACHLESRRAFVDRNRPTVAVETPIPFTLIKPGQVILARLSCGADAIGEVMAENDNDDSVAHGSLVVHIYDSHDGNKFFSVWLSHDGSTYTGDTPEDARRDSPLLRTVSSVLMRINLTPTNMLKDTSRAAVVEAGYLEA
ncbi:hypothetical protein Pmar_PMAR026398 [Perkinsus marinus ATCC 50983]|uniref:Integrase catalytic domain-containing protein n=1 Tax=Perkinsus marinus (strain ATCC 50983 / TXsc) TaxID=423536 RepID=C5LEM8_PERM5|nr:hypothetical protein Pmar_PMAR026398 [Perkinsus marinus ATCC 50983]EER04846.1 hypothetical protein Pmar_PMAR026398 [Perkinsus marinus ATCC 50983]|eukprot:XP_002773030.1 hypothetical protein Pmar_PMAR026398 [Perkinsus marinus ATCC 50983]